MSLNPIEELFVEITNHCLQNCIHCSSCASEKIFQSIPIEKIYSVIEETIPLGLKYFTISGGEPLLYPKLKELIAHLNAKGLIFNIYSCGISKNANNEPCSIPNSLLNYLKKNNINKLIFSIQGGTEKIHEEITQFTGSFYLTLESIKRALSKNIFVELHFVPMKKNIDELNQVINIAQSLNIKQLSLLRLVVQGRCSSDLELSIKEYYNMVNEVNNLNKQLTNKLNIRLGSPFNCITLSGKPCTAAQNKLLISATGEFFPCEAFKYLKGTRPTIYTSSVKSIWENDELLNNIRKAKLSSLKHCHNCSDFSKCLGGCYGQRNKKYKNLYEGPDLICVKFQ